MSRIVVSGAGVAVVGGVTVGLLAAFWYPGLALTALAVTAALTLGLALRATSAGQGRRVSTATASEGADVRSISDAGRGQSTVAALASVLHLRGRGWSDPEPAPERDAPAEVHTLAPAARPEIAVRRGA